MLCGFSSLSLFDLTVSARHNTNNSYFLPIKVHPIFVLSQPHATSIYLFYYDIIASVIMHMNRNKKRENKLYTIENTHKKNYVWEWKSESRVENKLSLTVYNGNGKLGHFLV